MPFKRVLTRSFAALALGAAITVLVALIASLAQVAPTRDYGDPTPADFEAWARSIPPGFPPEPANTTITNHLALGYYTVYVFGGANAEATLYIVRAGLPLKCFEGAEFQDGVSPPIVTGLARLHSNRFLPLRPLWLPFTINSLLFGSICVIAAEALRRLRRLRRRRSGACMSCGHVLATARRCPECGTSRPDSPDSSVIE
jgi:hypothetical protein